MEVVEAILTRRSIREYTDRPVTPEQIRTLLEAAMQAPSAGDHRPRHFVVIRDRGLLHRVTEIHPYAAMLDAASAAILVCGDTDKEMAPGYWIQDCSAAMENILLAAHGMGLGAVWLGVHPRPERVSAVRRLFELPEHVPPLGIASIGYPAEHKPRAERYDESRVHTDRW